jgi:hypothetical protein
MTTPLQKKAWQRPRLEFVGNISEVVQKVKISGTVDNPGGQPNGNISFKP